MSGEHAFLVEGAVVAELSPKTYRIELSNGHRLLGFVPGKRAGAAKFAAGDRVMVRLSPFDLSEGRIMVETKKDVT